MIEGAIFKDFALVKTDKEFVIAIKDSIHGPFKVTDVGRIIKILKEVENEARN